MTAKELTIDCKGMVCPAPILKVSEVARANKGVPVLLTVLANDNDFPSDIEAWCRSSKSNLLRASQQPDGVYVALISLNGGVVAGQSGESALKDTLAASPSDYLGHVTTAEMSEALLRAESSTTPASLALTIDCKGLVCPAPILKVSEAAKARNGTPTLLTVLANDNDFPSDIEAWCRSSKSQLLRSSQRPDGVYEALISLHGATPPQEPAVTVAAPLVQTAPAPLPVAHRESEAGVLTLVGVPASRAMLELSVEALRTPGRSLHVVSDAPDFESALRAWSTATQAVLQNFKQEGNKTIVALTFPGGTAATQKETALAVVSKSELAVENKGELFTILLTRNDLDVVLPALIVSNSAAAQGSKVEIFFAFWALNLLRGDRPRGPGKSASFIQQMMHWMMPKGPRRQTLSKMNMAGIGTGLMEHLMKKNNVMAIDELLQKAVEGGVTFTVCSLSMGVLGIQERDLMPLPNLRFAGLTSFSELAQRSKVSLVF